MPPASLQDQLSNINTFHVFVSSLPDQVLVLFLHCALIYDIIQRPGGLHLSSSDRLPCFVHSCHLLFQGSEEALRVEESTQPECVRPTSFEPLIQLLIPFYHIVEPFGECGDDPGDFCSSSIVDPLDWHSGIENGVNRVHDLSSHDDLSVNSITDVDESLPDDVKDDLHSSDLLV